MMESQTPLPPGSRKRPHSLISASAPCPQFALLSVGKETGVGFVNLPKISPTVLGRDPVDSTQSVQDHTSTSLGIPSTECTTSRTQVKIFWDDQRQSFIIQRCEDRNSGTMICHDSMPPIHLTKGEGTVLSIGTVIVFPDQIHTTAILNALLQNEEQVSPLTAEQISNFYAFQLISTDSCRNLMRGTQTQSPNLSRIKELEGEAALLRAQLAQLRQHEGAAAGAAAEEGTPAPDGNARVEAAGEDARGPAAIAQVPPSIEGRRQEDPCGRVADLGMAEPLESPNAAGSGGEHSQGRTGDEGNVTHVDAGGSADAKANEGMGEHSGVITNPSETSGPASDDDDDPQQAEAETQAVGAPPCGGLRSRTLTLTADPPSPTEPEPEPELGAGAEQRGGAAGRRGGGALASPSSAGGRSLRRLFEPDAKAFMARVRRRFEELGEAVGEEDGGEGGAAVAETAAAIGVRPLHVVVMYLDDILGQLREAAAPAGAEASTSGAGRPLLSFYRFWLHQGVLKPITEILLAKEWKKWGNPFTAVITRENCHKMDVPDYFDVIETPMNLKWIKAKVDKHKYLTFQQFDADIDLMLENAMTYNREGEPVFAMAKVIRDMYKQKVADLQPAIAVLREFVRYWNLVEEPSLSRSSTDAAVPS